jgi:DNA-binding CsgD family transcriptional regulator
MVSEQARPAVQVRVPGAHPPARVRRGPAGGWASLTGTEQAVSLLVVERLTNGAVARRLSIPCTP